MVDQDFERRIASLYAAREQGDAVGREVRVWLFGKSCRLMFVHPSSVSIVPARRACLTKLTPFIPSNPRVPHE